MPVAPLSSRYRRAFITGASGGLGRAFAEMLLAEGIDVTGTARDVARLEPLAAHPRFTPLALDLADGAAAEKKFTDAAGEGAFDLVINNAGFGVFAPFVATEFAVWQAQLEALIGTSTRLAHAALRAMAVRPGSRGCLVNVSSLAAEFPLPFMSGYNVAKAALSALSESLLFETRGAGLTVIDFCPGDYRTDFNRAMQPAPALFSSSADPRLARAWRVLAAHLEAAPPPEKAARDLRAALRRGRGGIVRSGTFFQARLAPMFARFMPAGLRRAVIARYQGAG
jgi:short-subunit dehydrogenase